VALFSKDGRTFNLELVRDGDTIVEEQHVAGDGPRRRRFADAAAALAGFRDRVLELIADDWKLSATDDDLAHPLARDPDVEQRIATATDTDRRGLLAVYADWLGERGDPCGDLAAPRARSERGHTAELGAAIQRLELARERDLFGIGAALPNYRSNVVAVWRDGWIDGYDLATPSGTVTTLALLAPMARFVRALTFQHQQSTSIRSAIATWPRREQIRKLVLPHTAWAQELLDVLPGLDELEMPVSLRDLRGHPHVRSLVLSVADVRKGKLGGAWPAVQRVVVRYHGRGEPPSALDLIDEAALPAKPEIVVRVEKR